jgi:putative NADPH-quinone reductase
MSRNVLVVNGHPDPRPERFCAALCDAYELGARQRGCATRRLDVGALQLSALAASEDAPLDRLEEAYRLMRAADRLAIVYPLWADAPPAELKQLFDYVARLESHLHPERRMEAKAAKVVVTSALPGFFYRDKTDGETLALSGVAAGEPTFIGSVDSISEAHRKRWLDELRGLGAAVS